MAVVGRYRFFCTENGAKEMKLIDRFELAEMWGVHPATVTKWRKQGLPFYKLSRLVIRFDEEQVLRWVEQQTRNLTTQEDAIKFYGGRRLS